MCAVTVYVPYFPVVVPPCTEGGNQQLVIGTTSMRISDQSIETRIIVIKNDDQSPGNVYVCIDGNDCKIDRGFRLSPGQFVSIAISDLSKITLIADNENVLVYVMWCR